MWRGAKANELWRQRNQSVVAIVGDVIQADVDRHPTYTIRPLAGPEFGTFLSEA